MLVTAVLVVVLAGLSQDAVAQRGGGSSEPRVGDWTFTTSSFAGVSGDMIRAVGIQSDGTIVLAGRISDGPLIRGARQLGRGPAAVIRLSEDGRRLISATRLGDDVRDMALDDQDNIYLAMGQAGVARLDPQAQRIVWRQAVDGLCARVDVSGEGIVAALRYDRDADSTPGAGTIYILNPQGRIVSQFRGHRHTLDLAIDVPSRTVVHIGWRQANAFDGSRTFPVQIAYMRGMSLDGQEKYLLYDWPVDRNAPGFLNRPTNNMADTRGYRITRGRDGKIYAGFEAAGGNHIFRYEPVLSDDRWVSAGGKRTRGDQFFEWHNSRSEHKLFVGRYDPATGEYLKGQQFAGRLDTGRTNTVRMVEGALAADEKGRLLAGGAAGVGLPLMFTPPGTGGYTGGSYALLLTPGMDGRSIMTRMDAGGRTTAADVRTVNGKTRVVIGGNVRTQGDVAYWTHHALQEPGEAGSGFFAVLHER